MEYSGLNDKNDVIIHEPESVADSLAGNLFKDFIG